MARRKSKIRPGLSSLVGGYAERAIFTEIWNLSRRKPKPYIIEPVTALYFFLGANLIAAFFAPIQDCDETFNYWEPTHYLSHGHGLQTWEYDPQYGIRSWVYIALHAMVGGISEFYFIRLALAFVCAICQTLFWRAIASTLQPRMALIYIFATIFSPGNFNASVAYLPSSFAMYTGMLGAAAFMRWRGGLKTAQGIFWFGLGGIVGWPFAAALAAPFLAEEAIFALSSNFDSFVETVLRFGRGVILSLIVLFLDTCVNSFFYRKLVVASWNIIRYNLFSSSGGGPSLYGTESWTFYPKNLLLNFHLWFVLALLAAPLFLLQKLVGGSRQGFQSGLRTLVFVSPFYLWLGIFTLQPHKEERFMYPVYPFLALNAAVSSHILLVAFGHTGSLVGLIPAKVKLGLVGILGILSASLGLARIYGLYQGYSAPMRIYEPLWDAPLASSMDHICMGKDWYRFPSSFFVPDGLRARFVRSEFRGLLPGQFREASHGFGFFPGAWMPTGGGVNDRNREDPSVYVQTWTCRFMIDTQYPEATEPRSELEPNYATDTAGWEEMKCLPFLDTARTHVLARILWVPDTDLIPDKYRRRWGRHCLLRQKSHETEASQ